MLLSVRPSFQVELPGAARSVMVTEAASGNLALAGQDWVSALPGTESRIMCHICDIVIWSSFQPHNIRQHIACDALLVLSSYLSGALVLPVRPSASSCINPASEIPKHLILLNLPCFSVIWILLHSLLFQLTIRRCSWICIDK